MGTSIVKSLTSTIPAAETDVASLPDDKATRRMQDIYQEPVRPELVAEVAYENVLNGRFRHGGRFGSGDEERPVRRT